MPTSRGRSLMPYSLDRRLTYSPIALQLTDEFTGQAPVGQVRLSLQQWDIEDGDWRPTTLRPVSHGGVLSFPGLGRAADLSDGTRRFRIQIDADFYRPHYRKELDGLEFEAHLYNDQSPLEPSQYALGPRPETHFRMLVPNKRYPFPSHVSVIRGRLEDSMATEKVADAEVGHGNDTVITDEPGDFALPIRWPPQSTKTTSPVAAGDAWVPVDRLRGLFQAEVRIDSRLYRVAEVDAANSRLRIRPTALTSPPAKSNVELVQIGLFVKPRGGVPIDPYPQVPFATAFTKSHTISI